MSKISMTLGTIVLVVLGVLAFTVKPMHYHHQKESHDIAMVTDEKQLHEWHEFVSPMQKFKVLLPTLPQHAQENVNDPKTHQRKEYDMYVSEKDNGTVFMISLITIGSEGQLNEEALSNVMHDMLTGNPRSKLKNVKMGKYHGYPSLDFSIESEQAIIDGKVFLSGSTLYLLTSASRPEQYSRQEFDYFVNSFELTPKTEK